MANRTVNTITSDSCIIALLNTERRNLPRLLHNWEMRIENYPKSGKKKVGGEWISFILFLNLMCYLMTSELIQKKERILLKYFLSFLYSFQFFIISILSVNILNIIYKTWIPHFMCWTCIHVRYSYDTYTIHTYKF